MRVTQYTLMRTVSHYCIDLKVVVTHNEKLQCANKDREVEDCKLINMEGNRAGFKILKVQLKWNCIILYATAYIQTLNHMLCVMHWEKKNCFYICLVSWQCPQNTVLVPIYMDEELIWRQLAKISNVSVTSQVEERVTLRQTAAIQHKSHRPWTTIHTVSTSLLI